MIAAPRVSPPTPPIAALPLTRVRIYLTAALLALALTLSDVLLLGAPLGPAFAVRLSLAGGLVVVAWTGHRGALSVRAEGVLMGLLGCAGLLGVLLLTGGRASPYYPTLFSIPLMMVVED